LSFKNPCLILISQYKIKQAVNYRTYNYNTEYYNDKLKHQVRNNNKKKKDRAG